jgi:hypothetical protein
MRSAILAGLGALVLATGAQAAPRDFGVGDLVYRKDTREALPNAFGGKDIFGRKRNTGYTEIRYLGIGADGLAHFVRRDVSIMTNENTMNRSGMGFATVDRWGGSTMVTTHRPATPMIQALPPTDIELAVDIAKDPTIFLLGETLTVLSASPNRVSVDVPVKK